MKRALLAALALLTAVPAASAYDGHTEMGPAAVNTGISIGFDAFAPPAIDVLTGDSVSWSNDSVRAHTVTADDGSWDSGSLPVGGSFSHRFDAPGAGAYYCTLHPFMRGVVDVSDLLLRRPSAPAGPGHPYPITGRAALPSGSTVTIEADSGQGFRAAATTSVGADGSFATTVVLTTTASFRAAAGTVSSPPVQLIVLDHTVTTVIRRIKGHRLRVDASVSPASPGSRVVLQYHLKDRFGWWPVATARLDRRSHARFRTLIDGRAPLRVVLTLPDRATVLATSRVQRAY